MKKLDSDTFPRVTIRDLFMVLNVFDRAAESTLENIRLRICVDRKKQRKGTSLWSAARDTVAELVRLGLMEGICQAKNTQQYETMKGNRLCLTEPGANLLRTFKQDRAAVYDDLLTMMVAKHPYLQRFISVMSRGHILAPVISSMRDHVSGRYAANTVLASDIAKGEFDFDSLLEKIETRLGRSLGDGEREKIVDSVNHLVVEAQASAVHEDTTEFAKSFLNKLNDIVVPAVLSEAGLGFDYRTHRTLWTVGQEFRVWAVVRFHPKYDGSLVFLTSTLTLNESETELMGIAFDYGLKRTSEDFLAKLYAAYQKVSGLTNATFAKAWELRSVFCFDNKCQPSVFDKLFADSASGSPEYKLQLEIQRQKPQHENTLRANNRNIGSVRVVRR